MNSVLDASLTATDNTVTVQWQKPEGDIAGYRVTCSQKYGDDDDSEKKEVKIDDADTTEAIFADLKPGTEYAAAIYAVVSDGSESNSVCVEGKTSKLTKLMYLCTNICCQTYINFDVFNQNLVCLCTFVKATKIFLK